MRATFALLIPSTRLRTVGLTALFAFSTFAVQAAPSDIPLPRPEALTPAPAAALGCASEPVFTGHITSSTSSTTVLAETTTGNVSGYISDVVDDWSCTAYYRYDGMAWSRADGDGVFDWGAIIHSTSVPCNWVVGETNYLKANDTTDCADTDAEYAMPVALVANSLGTVLEGIWHADNSPDELGDFMFIHSDCTSYYEGSGMSGERVRYQVPFGSSEVTNRPGDNCDPTVIDGTGTSQTLVVDGTDPVLNFDWPDEGTGPTVVTSAFAGVKFDATDAVAGFGGADDWDLQREAGSWNGSSCTGWATDGTIGAATSSTTNAADQVVGQGLLDNTCYRWTLSARDENGNDVGPITSGSIRTDLAGNLGQQDQHTFETWDLGAGDSLAVNVGTGNLVLSHPIVDLPIRGGSVSLAATYNSHDTTNVGMSGGWRLDAFRRLTVNGDNTVTFTDGDGSRHTFTAPTGSPTVTYTRPATLYATLTRDTAATPDRFTLTYRDQSKDLFDELTTGTGFLIREQDRHGNGVDFGYVGSELRTITDSAPNPDRVIDLTWSSGKLTKIEDWAYVDGSGVVQTTATGARRTTRFFYDGSNKLIGWADPLNTSGTCATQAPHLTCLTITGGLVSAISKSQTVEKIASGALTGDTPVTISTTVTYRNLDVTAVKDASQTSGTSDTLLTHPGVGQTRVLRRGTPDAEAIFTLNSVSDSHARITSIKRLLAPSTWIEQTTTYDGTYPIEPATVTSNATAAGGAPARTVTTTYVGSSMGLVSKMSEPLTATDDRWTEYVYNANNDVTQKSVSLEGANATVTRGCYHATTCNTSDADLLLRRTIEGYVDGTKGGSNGDDEDVTTEYQYDAYGQKTRETRHNYDGGTLLDSRVLGWTYDVNGNTTASVANYVDGSVAGSGDDVTPNASTNARTDLTTAFTHDTAGNEVSVADPRRAIALATAGTTHALDTFARSVTDGWGSAGTGGSWSGTDATFDVNGSLGTIALASATNRNGYLTSVSAADQELLLKVNVNQLAAGSDTFSWVYLRRQDASNFYELRATFEPDQELRLSFRKTVGGSASSIGSAMLSGETHTTGNWYWIRARLTGTTAVTLKARLWRDGSTEPPTWALDATDVSAPAALQGAGHLGIRFQATGSGTYPVTASFDELSLTSIGGMAGVGVDDYLTRSEFDALDHRTKEVSPTTPGLVISQKLATWTYDELGAVRESQGMNDVLTGTAYDKAGRAIKTFEDEDGAGGVAAAQTSETTLDAAGRPLTIKDRRQVADGTLGHTLLLYDSLGRTLAQTDAVGTSAESETTFTYDGLDRQLTVTTGVDDATAQTTTTSYDLGGRALTTDDEFTCATSTYDHRDLVQTVIEGRAVGTCTGSGLRTITNSFDKLGRQWKSAVTAGQGNGDATMDDRLDSAGRRVYKSATQSGATTTTTYTLNGLDQAWEEVRSDGSTAKTNFDPAGNGTDRCFWHSGPADPCTPVGTPPGTYAPTQATTTLFDARNNRIGLTDSATSATTTYDPAHAYQVDAVYTPTLAGSGREYQALYDYDNRDRLTSVSHQLCVISAGHACSSTVAMGSTALEYDNDDNRARVNESTSAGSLDRHYCYDALDRVLSTRSATGCSTGLVEAYTYDDSGNRLTAGSTTFTYDAESQLSSCSPSCGTVAYDAAGRTSKWNGWAFEYDADGRMTRACQSATDCSGLLNEVEFVYDGDGHRTKIVRYDSGSGTAVATREFRYQGDAIVEEKLTDAAHPSGAVVRSYVVDESGSAVKMTIPGSESNPGNYLVTWNGHGDALGLWAINGTDGTLTLANSFTYTTWGAATVGTHNGYPDLGFRFRYVGAADVQWDDVHGLGLYYMHARHYSPSLGRFLQPDPSRLDQTAYGYADNGPVAKADPEGLTSTQIGINHATGLQFELRYLSYLRRFGWRIERVHAYESTRQGGRFIDIIATKNGVTWRIELKVGSSRYFLTSQFWKDVEITARSTRPTVTRIVRSSRGFIKSATIRGGRGGAFLSFGGSRRVKK